MSFHHVKCLNLCILQIMKINQTHKINRPSNLSQPNPQPYLKKCSPHFAQYMCICNFLFHINASLFWMLKEKAQSFSLHKWDKSFNNFLKLCCGLSQTGRFGFEVGLGVRKTKREIKELRNLKVQTTSQWGVRPLIVARHWIKDVNTAQNEFWFSSPFSSLLFLLNSALHPCDLIDSDRWMYHLFSWIFIIHVWEE